MSNPPRLMVSPWIKGTPICYECSLCRQAFLTPEDRSPKEAMEELLEAFEEHIREKHSGEMEIREASAVESS